MTYKNILRLFALLTVVALLLAACDQADKSNVPERPSVVLKVGDQIYEEPVYSYCWPESTDNLDCAINDSQLTQPSAIADIQPGQEIHFRITGDASTPSSITATLLDGPGGVQDLGVSTEAAYSAATAPGLYRVQVDVQYADIGGQQAYLSYIFGLNVGGQAVAAAPTVAIEATEPPILEATSAPTLTPVSVEPVVTAAMTEAAPLMTEEAAGVMESAATEMAEVSESATVEAIETEVLLMPEATLPATEETMLPASTEPAGTAEAVAMLTEEAPGMALTVEATEAVFEALPLGELTPEATEAVEMAATAGATEVAPQPTAEVVEPVSTEMLPTAMATEDLGTGLVQTLEAAQATEVMEVTAEATMEMTAEIPAILTAEATEVAMETATASATEEALPTAVATEEMLVATPTVSLPTRPTRTPEPTLAGPTPTVTLALPTQPGSTTQLQVPLLTLTYAGKEYAPVGYQFCEIVTWGEHICVNVPASETVPQRILFLRGLTVDFNLSGETPSSLTVEYRSDQGEPTGTPETHESDDEKLKLVISPEPGDYIMIVHVMWDVQQQDASYFFRVSVLD